ncbi:hypothetical protein Mgra_00001055 [Meloidogyne graminicola]|uniref:Neurotransmitter-gated ion-channel ligand-binding domain-containing protein n=1 Tax=Meloidogyne graminicola TaxID=189291 RepID=A0A8T0A1X2_9BILA|nr:hypothetical protein Mgra_00001055 [Meloidogyne graminicola]
MQRFIIFLIKTIYLMFFIFIIVSGDVYMTKLYRYLFVDYNKEIRPIVNSNLPINTSIAFSLVQVVDVDERNQLLTVLAWVHLRWNDWRLAWDPNKFVNLDSRYYFI